MAVWRKARLLSSSVFTDWPSRSPTKFVCPATQGARKPVSASPPASAAPAPPAPPVPGLPPAPVVPAPPDVPPVPGSRTHRCERQTSPGSHPPPFVHTQLSLPTAQDDPLEHAAIHTTSDDRKASKASPIFMFA